MDPERGTELLWRAGPRRGLSLERIVRAAVELADAEGLASVSMRRVAQSLGFTTMSLYRHVPGKAELVALMRDEVMGELAAAHAHSGSDWRTEIEAWARAGMEMHRRHPWLAESAGTRQLPGPNGVAVFERALSIMVGLGLSHAQVVAAATLVGGFVESAARQAAESARAEQDSGVSDEDWWGARDSLFEHLDRYPTLSRIYAEGGYDAPLDPFEFGLGRVLDGVESLIRDESGDKTSDGTDGSRCVVCGGAVGSASTGRPRDYCSHACRQRAYRQRRGGPPAAGGDVR